MKRVLLVLATIIVVVIVAVGVAVASKLRKESRANAFCKKMQTLVTDDKGELEGGLRGCETKAFNGFVEPMNPYVKASWTCKIDCSESAATYAAYTQCEKTCNK